MVFIKDMAYFLVPHTITGIAIAPSFGQVDDHCRDNNTEGEGLLHPQNLQNPTVLPLEVLRSFHFTFLIRNPRLSIPSYYRCTVPPLCKVTGVSAYDSKAAGYRELRLLYDYLVQSNVTCPEISSAKRSQANHGNLKGSETQKRVKICVIKAEALLESPIPILRTYCEHIGIPFSENMLSWGDASQQKHAREQLDTWKGFHEDAICSDGLWIKSNVG